MEVAERGSKGNSDTMEGPSEDGLLGRKGYCALRRFNVDGSFCTKVELVYFAGFFPGSWATRRNQNYSVLAF